MTLEEAFEDFTESETFKETAKRKDVPEGTRYRMSLSRFKKGKLGKAAIIELLEANGYVIKADKVEKKD
jgi:hypothetical protein